MSTAGKSVSRPPALTGEHLAAYVVVDGDGGWPLYLTRYAALLSP